MKCQVSTYVLLSLALFTVMQSVNANPRAMFKRIGAFSGAGCEQNTVTVAGENSNTVSVLFSKYDAGRNSRSGALHTSCEFSLPISVPAGQRLSVLTAEWQGYVKGRGGLSRLYSAVGPRQRPWRISRYNAAEGKNYLEQDDMYPRDLNTNCSGGEYTLRIKSDLLAASLDSYIAVDTVDLKNQVVFRLNWVPCQ